MKRHPDIDTAIGQFLELFELDIDDMADDGLTPDDDGEAYTQRRYECAAQLAQEISDNLKKAC